MKAFEIGEKIVRDNKIFVAVNDYKIDFKRQNFLDKLLRRVQFSRSQRVVADHPKWKNLPGSAIWVLLDEKCFCKSSEICSIK